MAGGGLAVDGIRSGILHQKDVNWSRDLTTGLAFGIQGGMAGRSGGMGRVNERRADRAAPRYSGGLGDPRNPQITSGLRRNPAAPPRPTGGDPAPRPDPRLHP